MVVNEKVVNEKRKRGAFTLAELLVALGIVLLLVALVGGAVVGSRRSAQTSAFLSNLRQWNGALQAYQQDYDGTYPAIVNTAFVKNQGAAGDSWYAMLRPYTNHQALICSAREVPAALNGYDATYGYALNISLNRMKSSSGSKTYQGKSEALLQAQSNVVAVFDARPGILASDAPDLLGVHKGKRLG